jgi:hypothetical protein
MVVTNLGPVVATAATHTLLDVNHHNPLPDSSGLPANFPGILNSPMAWTGREFMRESDYVYRFEDAEIQELEAALEHFKGVPRIHPHMSC